MTWAAERMVAFYNRRERQNNGSRQCCQLDPAIVPPVRRSAARLQLHGLIYNLANFPRTLAVSDEIKCWSLNALCNRLVKLGAWIVCGGRSPMLPLAEVVVLRILFAKMLAALAVVDPALPARC